VPLGTPPGGVPYLVREVKRLCRCSPKGISGRCVMSLTKLSGPVVSMSDASNSRCVCRVDGGCAEIA